MTTRHQLNNTELANHTFFAGYVRRRLFPAQTRAKKEKTSWLNCAAKSKPNSPKISTPYNELTHAATERFNELAEEFDENDSEIETVARDTIATDMEYIAQSYGFEDADIEELVAPRDW